jgi:hypothetical protein
MADSRAGGSTKTSMISPIASQHLRPNSTVGVGHNAEPLSTDPLRVLSLDGLGSLDPRWGSHAPLPSRVEGSNCGYQAVVSGRAFAVVAALGLALAALCLGLAGMLDSTLLAVAGVMFVVAVLVAREGWLWRGDLRGWLTMMGGLVLVVIAAYAVSALA